MVVVTLLSHAKFEPNEHQEDAPNFGDQVEIIKTLYL